MRDTELVSHAKSMRQQATEPEQRMWLAIRAKRFGEIKFRRQKVIGPYIVDFAARDPMLMIEIDGDTHGRATVTTLSVPNFWKMKDIKWFGSRTRT